jgi:hypothetical protein
MENELDLTREEPEGVTAVIPGDKAPAPEQEETAEPEATEEPEGEAETEETAEEPEKSEPEKPVEKKKTSWEIRRITELSSQRRDAEKRAADAEAELQRLRAAAKPAPAVATEEAAPVDADQIRARARDEIRQEEAIRIATERFNEACQKTFDQGVAAYGRDFEDAAETMRQTLSDEMNQRPEFLQVITDLENGHQVYYELSRNPEEAERLLKMPSHKMILELGRMSDKVAKPVVKPISKAPAPVSPVGGTPKNTARLDDDDVPMDQFATLLLTRLATKA